jgi:hypothetical protein
MTAAASPQLALDRLADMSPHIREAVVLDTRGRCLAGSPALAGPARDLLAHTDGSEVEVATRRGVVYAARAQRSAIALVAARAALPSLMLYDLRVVLGDLDEALA